MSMTRRVARSWPVLVVGVGLLAAAGWAGLRWSDGVTGQAQEGIVMAADGPVRAPEFPPGLPWLNTSTPLTLAGLRGKVVLLDFWTYCCINCMHVLPELKKLERKWPDELVVIGVHSGKFSSEGETANIRQAILRHEVDHPVINDADFQVWRSYGARAWPTVALISPTGYLVGMRSGEFLFEDLDPVIERLVRESEAAGTLVRGPLELTSEASRAPRSLLSFPGKVLADGPGGRLFIADSTNHRILIASLAGEIRQVIGGGEAGFQDGDFATAQFRQPQGMALADNTLYVCDTENHALRAVDLTAGRVTTVAGNGRKPRQYNLTGRGRAVSLHSPWDVEWIEGVLYVAMAGSHQLWTVDPVSGSARPFAGSGREALQDGPRLVAGQRGTTIDPGRSAALAQPSGLALLDGHLYFADSETSAVRRVEAGSGEVTTLIGEGLFEFGDIDGTRPAARLQHPLDVEAVGQFIYIADTYNNKIKRLDPSTGRVDGFVGEGPAGMVDGRQARFDEPAGLSSLNGKLYVADTNNHAIRVVDLATRVTTTLRLTDLSRLVDVVERPDVATPRRVRAGAATLTVVPDLPAGHKLNDGAPVSLRVVADEAGLVTLPGGRRSLTLRPDNLSSPVTLVAGSGNVVFEVLLYYCTDADHGACYPAKQQVAIDLAVAGDAEATELVVPAKVVLPD